MKDASVKMWKWLSSNGFEHWGQCSAEAVRDYLIHSPNSTELSDAQFSELWCLVKGAALEEEEEAQ